MFKNYLKTAFRNLFDKRGFAIINLLGLSIGMTCCLLIFQYVAYEYSFDTFHERKDNLYRVLQAYAEEGRQTETGHAFTAQALAPALKAAVPEIEEICRLHPEDAVVADAASPDKVFEDDKMLYVDPAFLKMFSFSMIADDRQNVLKSGTTMLSQSAAMRFFGTQDALGKTLDVTNGATKSYTVTGVFRDVPSNSHLQFDVLLPMEDLLTTGRYSTEPEGGWSWNNFSTYVQLHRGANIDQVNKKMTQVFLQNRGEMLKQRKMVAALEAQPLKEIHLNGKVQAPGEPVMGSSTTVYFFVVIGLITLIIALVNYVNLATVRAVNRSREVGVRKAIGAARSQLVIQFLAESALTNMLAALLAIVVASMLVPVVNDIAQTQLNIELWMNPGFWIAVTITLVSGTVLAGVYPAFVLSSFKPALVLKGRNNPSGTAFWLRRGLVSLQFAASIMLVASTVVVYDQLSYMRRLDLGLNLDQVISVMAPRILPQSIDRDQALQTFGNEVKRIPGVDGAAFSSRIPGGGFDWNGAAIRKAADDPSSSISGVVTLVDSAFSDIYKLKLVAGKGFHEVTLSDAEDTPWMVIVNESTASALGFASPADATDQMIDIGGYNSQIIGVYKDFNWSSAHQARENMVFGFESAGDYLSVRVSAANAKDVISSIEKQYAALFPGNIFHYAFADNSFDLQYRNDQRFARLFSISAGITIFIACLGLLGLVAFTAQQRTKEIGVRKVLGASAANLVTMLSRDFLTLVAIGFLIAVPSTWYFMSHWLENFAYRIEISPLLFVYSGLGTLALAFLTVGWQSYKAAVANPVKSLMSE